MAIESLSINLATVRQQWNVIEAAEACARHGILAIDPWRDQVAAVGLDEAVRAIKGNGLRVSGYCRGGMFPAPDAAGREAAIDDNKRAIDEAAALGADCLVLVVGGLPKGSRNIGAARQMVADGIAAILPHARANQMPIAIEPLHPMYAGDRSAVASMRDANELAESINHPLVGVALDVFHVWWESGLEAQIQSCADAKRLFAFHVCEFKPDFDHVLLDRGLPGEGVNASARIAKMVQAAGFDGLTEVEIFSRKYWAENQHDFLEKIIASCEAI